MKKYRFAKHFTISVLFLTFFSVCSSSCAKKNEKLMERYPATEPFSSFENLKKSDLALFLVVEDQVPDELLKDLPSDCIVFKHFRSIADGFENFVLEKEPLLSGEEIESVLYSKNTSNNQIVTIKFNQSGTEKLSQITYDFAGEDILIKIGENLLLNARIQSRITNGQIVFYCSDVIALKKLVQLYGSSEYNAPSIPEGFVLLTKNDIPSSYENPDKMNPTDITRSFFYYYITGDEKYKNFVSYEKNYDEDFAFYQKKYASLKNPTVKIGLMATEKLKVSKKRTLNMADSYGTSSMRYKKIPVIIEADGIKYSTQAVLFLEKDNKGYKVVSIPK